MERLTRKGIPRLELLGKRIRDVGRFLHEATGLGEPTEEDVALCRGVVSTLAGRIGIQLDNLSGESAFKVDLPKGPVEVRLFPEPDKPPAILIRRLLNRKHVYGNSRSRVYMIYLIDNGRPADSLLVVKYHETPGQDMKVRNDGRVTVFPHLYTGFATPSNLHNGYTLHRNLVRELTNSPDVEVSSLPVTESGAAFLSTIREKAPIFCY